LAKVLKKEAVDGIRARAVIEITTGIPVLKKEWE